MCDNGMPDMEFWTSGLSSESEFDRNELDFQSSWSLDDSLDDWDSSCSQSSDTEEAFGRNECRDPPFNFLPHPPLSSSSSSLSPPSSSSSSIPSTVDYIDDYSFLHDNALTGLEVDVDALFSSEPDTRSRSDDFDSLWCFAQKEPVAGAAIAVARPKGERKWDGKPAQAACATAAAAPAGRIGALIAEAAIRKLEWDEYKELLVDNTFDGFVPRAVQMAQPVKLRIFREEGLNCVTRLPRRPQQHCAADAAATSTTAKNISDLWKNSGGIKGATLDPSSELRCKYGSVLFGALGRAVASRQRFVEISFVDTSTHPAARHHRRVFHLLPNPKDNDGETEAADACGGAGLFPWPDRLVGGLRKLILSSVDYQRALAAARPQGTSMSIVTAAGASGDDAACLANIDSFVAPLRPDRLSISSSDCADLLYMDRGKRRKVSASEVWPYAYEQPRRRKGNNDMWQNAGGKRGLLKWKLTGWQADEDMLERRAGKILQMDPSLPVLRYHAYCVTRRGMPIGCHIFHVCPSASLIPSSMLTGTRSLYRSAPAPVSHATLHWPGEGHFADDSASDVSDNSLTTSSSSSKRSSSKSRVSAGDSSSTERSRKKARYAVGAAAIAMTALVLAFLSFRGPFSSRSDHDCATDTCPAGFVPFGEPLPCHEERRSGTAKKNRIESQGCLQWLLGPESNDDGRQRHHGKYNDFRPTPFAAAAQLGLVSYRFGGINTTTATRSRGGYRPSGPTGKIRVCTAMSDVQNNLYAYSSASKERPGWMSVGWGNDTAVGANRWPQRRAAPATWVWESTSMQQQSFALFGGFFPNCEFEKFADPLPSEVLSRHFRKNLNPEQLIRFDHLQSTYNAAGSGSPKLVGTQPRDLWSLAASSTGGDHVADADVSMNWVYHGGGTGWSFIQPAALLDPGLMSSALLALDHSPPDHPDPNHVGLGKADDAAAFGLEAEWPVGRHFAQTWSKGATHLMFSGQTIIFTPQMPRLGVIWTKMMLTDFWGLRLHTVTGEDRTPALHPTWQCLAANQHGDKGAQKRSDEPNPTQPTADAAYPSSRILGATWMAVEGEAWMFGGIGKQKMRDARTAGDSMFMEEYDSAEASVMNLCDLHVYRPPSAQGGGGGWSILGDCLNAAVPTRLNLDIPLGSTSPPGGVLPHATPADQRRHLELSNIASQPSSSEQWPRLAIATATTTIAGDLWMFGGGRSCTKDTRIETTTKTAAAHTLGCDLLTVYAGGAIFQEFGHLENGCSDALWVYRVRSNKWQQVHEPDRGSSSKASAVSWPSGQCDAQIAGSSVVGGKRTSDKTELRIVKSGWIEWPGNGSVDGRGYNCRWAEASVWECDDDS